MPRPAITAGPSGCMREAKEVAIPKLPAERDERDRRDMSRLSQNALKVAV